MSKQAFIEKVRQNPTILLALILGAFFLKEVFLADLFPMFTGQDEARHYNSIQYLAEPRPRTWEMTAATDSDQDKDKLETYRFSTEIKQTIVAAGLNANRENSFDKMSFAPNSFSGVNENEINQNLWPKINQVSPPDAVSGSIYHKLGSFIEKAFSGQSILVRFYLARLFSILLGTLALFFFYLTIKNCDFSNKATLALTAILSFQPRFSIYYTSVNYDALLILAFAIFIWSGTLLLKNGASWKNISLLAASAYLGYSTKATGIILIAVFIFILAWLVWKKLSSLGKNYRYAPFIIFVLAGVIILSVFSKYLPIRNGQSLGEITSSMGQYFSKSLTPGKLSLTSRTYWGSLGWTDSSILDNIVNFINILELLAIGGLVWFFFSKNPPDFLPKKKYIWLALIVFLAMQLGIRTADWEMFFNYGKIILGTPGRYFLPVLVSHIILIFTGLGMLTRKKEHFENLLTLSAVLMFSFMAYLIYDVIIFRFYL